MLDSGEIENFEICEWISRRGAKEIKSFAALDACCASQCPLWLYCYGQFAPRGRILGIGGIFFKAANQQEMREWYGKHLVGVMMPWGEKDNPEKEQAFLWNQFRLVLPYSSTDAERFCV